MTYTDALQKVLNELDDIVETRSEYHSWHEAYAILKEEVDEVWDEIRMKSPSGYACTEELKQVAAVAIKAMIQLGPPIQ